MKHSRKIAALLATSALLVSCADTNQPPQESSKNGMEQNIAAKEIYTDDGSVTLSLPEGEVQPYHENAIKYLSRENAKVHHYAVNIKNPGTDIIISWTSEHDDAESYLFEYGLAQDFSDAIKVELAPNVTEYALNNLYKDSMYYVKVTAVCTSGKYYDTGSFKVSANGPRVMTVDGVYNVRDIGGYKTADGKTTLQGMIYRGGQLDGSYVDQPVNITEKGIDTMLNVMKIRHDMDLRSANEQNLPLESPLPGVTFARYGFSGYNTTIDTESGKENLRAVFSALAKPENYPVYIHCQGGADRTGVLCFMINGLLGVDISDIIRDYEFTTFSLYGTRSTTTGAYLPYQDNIRQLIKRFDGETLSERIEQLLLYVGVTPEEIASIRSIMIPD